ncbi:MAG: peptidoglycan D,D-transpeptidase FtsI family protein [Elusimicrobiota bacterium]
MQAHRRINTVAVISLFPILPLSIRLAQLQIIEHRSLTVRADDELVRIAIESAPRASILDRNGEVLAESLATWACFVDKRMTKNPQETLKHVSLLINRPLGYLLKKYAEQKRFPWIAEDLSYEQVQNLKKSGIESLGIISRQKRFYPNGSLADNIIGKVGADGHGLSGLEYLEDQKLQEPPRRIQILKDGAGRTIYESSGQDAVPLAPLSLTIDRNIQFYAGKILSEAAAKFSIKSGVIAVENPSTGEILAMAAYPNSPLSNPGVQEMYEPGSTFKIVTAGAALNEGIISDKDIFFCENGIYELSPGVIIHDFEPEGNLTIAGILRYSSNIGISKVAQRLGAPLFCRYAKAFGFANKTGIDFPGETSGEVKSLDEMTRVNLAASSYGYGVGVSPVQILNAYSAIANGGVLLEPHLIKDGSSPQRIRRVISKKTDQDITSMLESVVETGTGVPARIPGYRIAGKTGTARMIDFKTHQYSKTAYNASFIGFLPVDHPRWTILVLIGDPKGRFFYGAEVAAPYFAEMARRLIAMNGLAPDAASDEKSQGRVHP